MRWIDGPVATLTETVKDTWSKGKVAVHSHMTKERRFICFFAPRFELILACHFLLFVTTDLYAWCANVPKQRLKSIGNCRTGVSS